MGWLGTVIAAAAILLCITLHEFGHFSTARAFGMKVPQFFVGFGPTIWSFKRGETEYGVKALPLGGFVRIVGQTSFEDIDPKDQGREMWRQPAWRKAIVMSAGSAMHFLIAIVILFGLYVTVGQKVDIGGAQVQSVSSCFAKTCTAGDAATPAVKAGLRAGDVIQTIDGSPISSTLQATQLFHNAPIGTPFHITVLRAGQPVNLVAATIAQQSVDAQGKPATVGLLGISVGDQLKSEHFGPWQSLMHGGNDFWQVTNGVYHAMVSLPSKIPALFDTHKSTNNNDRFISVVGAAQLGGDALKHDIPGFFFLIASLNISIGIFNLLPLPILDGGHLAIIVVEKTRSFFARRLRRPDPGRIDLLKLQVPALVFLLFFGTFAMLTIFQDIAHPIASPY